MQDEIEETTGASDGYVSLFPNGLTKAELYLLTDPANPTLDVSYTPISDAQYKLAFTTDIVDRANAYVNGLMYYCVPIEHLAATTENFGIYGMVRNHDYASP